jgi:hypothetical protein
LEETFVHIRSDQAPVSRTPQTSHLSLPEAIMATPTKSRFKSKPKAKSKSHTGSAPRKKTSAKRASANPNKIGTTNYTKPELREKIKERVVAGSKGGRAGQWSARKAQLVAHEYTAEGGGYGRTRNPAQKSLQQWGDERWHTSDSKPAVQRNKTRRYLPDAAWKQLSPQQRKATDRKKVAGSKRGKQFVANTAAATEARKHATRRKP